MPSRRIEMKRRWVATAAVIASLVVLTGTGRIWLNGPGDHITPDNILKLEIGMTVDDVTIHFGVGPGDHSRGKKWAAESNLVFSPMREDYKYWANDRHLVATFFDDEG